MTTLLRISEAASLAMHSMVYLATNPDGSFSTAEIAASLAASEAHLSKVLQRLTKHGLVRSVRGPRGGFALARPANDITLLEVYEAIEGPLMPSDCLLEVPVCASPCLLGELLRAINTRVRDYLLRTKVADLTHVYECFNQHGG